LYIAVTSTLSLGFPIVDVETNARANLYPFIVPITLALLALATRAVRLNRR
jgi:hypothetical protein